jgi:hypothetical protein
MKNILENYSKFKNYEKLIILFGFFGLTPFIVGLIDTWFNYPNLLFTINLTKNYGVIILTFLGSVYWGIILESEKTTNYSSRLKIFTLIWSITPALFGIIILSLEQNFSIIILSIGFLVSQLIDEIYKDILFFPKWYIYLRRALSFIVIVVLIFSYLIIANI